MPGGVHVLDVVVLPARQVREGGRRRHRRQRPAPTPAPPSCPIATRTS